jgi:8-oxo-dGTP diphosphatase
MAKEERFKIIPAIYGIFIKDGKILLLRRFQTGWQDGNYSLPAGHLDGGESLRQAMAREALEEVGVKIVLDDLDHALTMHRWTGELDNERIDFFFLVKKWQGKIKNAEPAKCDDLSWFSFDDLPQNMVPCIKEAISCYKKGIKYCEFGWKNKNK